MADSQIADNIAIDISLSIYNKKQTPKEKIRKKYIEIKNFYQENNLEVLATDGSKVDSEVGCAVFVNQTTYKFQLPHHSSIFTTETLAILKAI